ELLAGAAKLAEKAVTVAGGIRVVAEQVDGVGGGDLRTMALDIRSALGSDAAVVALVGGTGAKPVIAVATNEAARARGAKAGALVGVGAAQLGGRGGGKDDFAQGGGSNGAAASDAVRAVRDAVAAL
ncbi:DHHA1 domain-containing protein, partial [Micropruina sp.]|uniref:DHHA1 domain-containing protein n=1 Tax=Micropruina sp. TaxID=2737536 RepID=UPI0026184807